MTPKDYVGVYTFVHAGGEFDVHLRSQERFFAPRYQAKASWHFEGDDIKIDWGKFGKYTLSLENAETKSFKGSLDGKPESWRKMHFKRPFTVAETNLMDSLWNFIHPKGHFEVQFRADGYNHFVCESFPAHSHWWLEDDASETPTVKIDFAKYGKYELKMDADGQKMEGSAEGNPSNWRKAERIEALGKVQPAHEHDH